MARRDRAIGSYEGVGSAKRLLDPRSMRAAFVREYLIDLSPRDAAIRAGYSVESAPAVSSALMATPSVKDAIGRAMASRAARVGVNADRVLRELGMLAFGDPRAVLNGDGTLKAPHEMNDDDARMIVGVKTRRVIEVDPETNKVREAEIQEIKLVDKATVLSLAMRHLGMLNDKLSIDVHGSLAEQLEEARRRREGGDAVQVDGVSAEDLAALEAEERQFLEGDYEEVLTDGLEDLPAEARELLG